MRPVESFVGQPVRSLQTMLRVIGSDDNIQEMPVPDGIYGEQTKRAVSQFQRNRGIPVTGIVDLNTWERILAEYQPALVRTAPAEPLQLILNPGAVFRLGDESLYLYIIQSILLAFSEVYSSVSAPSLNGILDDITAQSVASFQYLNNLPQTGDVDKVTWQYLAKHYPMAVNHTESLNRQDTI